MIHGQKLVPLGGIYIRLRYYTETWITWRKYQVSLLERNLIHMAFLISWRKVKGKNYLFLGSKNDALYHVEGEVWVPVLKSFVWRLHDGRWVSEIKFLHNIIYKSPIICFEIYCHKNILHFEITQHGKPIFSHHFNVSLPHTTQIFLEIDDGESRN